MTKVIAFIVLLFFATPYCTYSQAVQVESIELDKLVWGKINDYLRSIGKKPISYFEDSLMREYSYRVTRQNTVRELIEHSDSVGYVSTGECIFREVHRGMNNQLEEQILEKRYNEIASSIFDGWVNSPSHRNLISIDCFAATTVTTVLMYDIDKGLSSVTASWHCLDYPHIWSTETNYVYKPR